MTTANGAYCVLQEARVTRPVVWAGGLHSGWNARMRAGWGVPRAVFSVGPSIRWTILPRFLGEKKNFLLLSRLPPSGGRGPSGLVARPEYGSYLLVALSFLVDTRLGLVGGGAPPL